MGEHRRCNHAKTNREDALARHLVVRFNGRIRALVGSGETRAAVFRRAGDPAETSVELLGAPRFCFVDHLLFGFTRFFFEHRHVVRALAPHEFLRCFLTWKIGVKKCGRVGGEVVELHALTVVAPRRVLASRGRVSRRAPASRATSVVAHGSASRRHHYPVG